MIVCKDYSCSPWPQKNVHNFSLEGAAIFLPAPFSNNYPSYSFCVCVKISTLLSYSIIMY